MRRPLLPSVALGLVVGTAVAAAAVGVVALPAGVLVGLGAGVLTGR